MNDAPSTPRTTATWQEGHAYQKGNVVRALVKVRPKWWQFWKRPHMEMQEFIVQEVSHG